MSYALKKVTETSEVQMYRPSQIAELLTKLDGPSQMSFQNAWRAKDQS